MTGDDDAPAENIPGSSVPAGAISKELLIINKRGLHARASAKFVQTVERFNAEIWVTRGSETVGGTSIMGLMMLAAGPGTAVTVWRRALMPRLRLPPSRSSLQASSTRKRRNKSRQCCLAQAKQTPSLRACVCQRLSTMRRPNRR